MIVIQIGANRGRDDFYNKIKNLDIEKMILVEPMSLHNEQLLKNYDGFSPIIENSAIVSTKQKSISFYYHEDDGPGFEVASIFPEHIKKHTHLDPNRIIEIQVPCLSINGLFAKYNLDHIDILFIDAESYDEIILKDINFEKFDITEIYFENLHLKDDSTYNFLQSKGYKILKKIGTNDSNSKAFKKNSQGLLPHYSQELSGENWFNYEDFYKFVISRLPDSSKIIEIGCWIGRSTSYLGTELINSGKNFELNCADIWEPYNEISNVKIFENDKIYLKFLENINPISDKINVIRKPSKIAANYFNDKYFDFIFIDAAHDFDNVFQDIKSWLPKLKDKGIIGGHDYYDNNDVVKAVKMFFNDDEIKIMGSCWYVELQ